MVARVDEQERQRREVQQRVVQADVARRVEVAAQVAGDTYRRLSQADLFNPSGQLPPVARLSTQSCRSR